VPEIMTTFAAALPAAEYDVEVLETHHHHKVDAPSGTAIAIGRLIAGARQQTFDEVAILGRSGHVGPRKAGAIGFGVIRAGEIVGESTVYFLSDDEEIIVTRRVFDRRVYATGSVLAAHWAAGRSAGFYTMREVIENAAPSARS
jgi:4-hydroxy-tetrahydrodipicolinate reductase